jgi:hypothetical protein
MSTHEDSIMKPTKHCLKEGAKRERKNGNIMEGVSLFKELCMYGIITMKSLCIINV